MCDIPPTGEMSPTSLIGADTSKAAQTVVMDAQQHELILKNMEEMATDNYYLREKLKELTTDRDRLLCEVANLRLELDMETLRRIPDDNK